MSPVTDQSIVVGTILSFTSYYKATNYRVFPLSIVGALLSVGVTTITTGVPGTTVMILDYVNPFEVAVTIQIPILIPVIKPLEPSTTVPVTFSTVQAKDAPGMVLS